MIIMLSAHQTWFKIILLLKVTFSAFPGPSFPPPPCALPHSTAHPICQGMAATGHTEVSSLGWPGTGMELAWWWQCLFLSWPLEGGRGGTEQLPQLKIICTINKD